MAEKKEKQYASDNARLMAEWDWDKNAGFKPAQLTCGSNIKVWWRCNQGHKWQAKVNSRNRGSGCPYCSGRYAVTGKNDLLTVNPTLASEWNYSKNRELLPEHFMPNSHMTVWWKCSEDHEWQAKIDNRSNGRGCPYCSGQKGLPGYNDLQTINPDLAKDWNYEKNGNLTPKEVSATCAQKVWWKCSSGHEWQSTIYNRANGRGCPICNSERTTSFPEYALVYYLEKHGLEVIHSYREMGYELDVYIPSLKTAIEYDGGYWHHDSESKDKDKNRKCQNDGITLYRIREDLLPLNEYSIDFCTTKKQVELQVAISKVLSNIIECDIDINLERDFIAIESLREYAEKEKSLLSLNPQLAAEWNSERNCDLKPEHLTPNSNKKVWWKCDNGHEWQATINSRNRGNGCPHCAKQKRSKNKNKD